MAFHLLLIAVLLACSAFFSGSETALFALSRHELSLLARDPRASHRLVAELMRRPRKLLLTLMIGNVSINMLIFATSLALFQQLAGHGRSAALAPLLGLISPLIVTLFGEILPKGISIVLRTRVAIRAAPLVTLAQIVLTPFSAVFSFALVEPLTRLLVGGKRHPEAITTEELQELVELSQRRRIIDADENAMLSEVIQLNELKVRDVMVPRVDIRGFDVRLGKSRLREMLREHGFTKLPVHDGSIDNILGLVYAKDVFLDDERTLDQLIHPVRFVPDLVTLTQLLAHFHRTRTQLAVVVDEHGGVVGLVTVEDVAEQIVGELSLPDEADEEFVWERLDERRYRVSGRLSVHDWTEQFNIGRLDVRVSTLAGLVVTELGRLPRVGDHVHVGNVKLTVESLRGRRIEWLIIELVDWPAEPATAGGKEVQRA